MKSRIIEFLIKASVRIKRRYPTAFYTIDHSLPLTETEKKIAGEPADGPPIDYTEYDPAYPDAPFERVISRMPKELDICKHAAEKRNKEIAEGKDKGARAIYYFKGSMMSAHTGHTEEEIRAMGIPPSTDEELAARKGK